jgi:hypothetical protein
MATWRDNQRCARARGAVGAEGRLCQPLHGDCSDCSDFKASKAQTVPKQSGPSTHRIMAGRDFGNDPHGHQVPRGDANSNQTKCFLQNNDGGGEVAVEWRGVVRSAASATAKSTPYRHPSHGLTGKKRIHGLRLALRAAVTASWALDSLVVLSILPLQRSHCEGCLTGASTYHSFYQLKQVDVSVALAAGIFVCIVFVTVVGLQRLVTCEFEIHKQLHPA